nr:DUF2778 domain-containing protein [Acetobacter sp. DmW_043]
MLNGDRYSSLTFPGVGSFEAFSGDGIYRNRGGCGYIPGQGSLPEGKYWIVSRSSGGLIAKGIAWAKDLYNQYHSGAVFRHSEWFALYRDDGMIDDFTFIKGVKRGNFRLHPGVLSDGCITLSKNTDFALLRNTLLRTPQMQVPGVKGLNSFGTIEVVNNGNNNFS